jgi:hypothetical protein
MSYIMIPELTLQVLNYSPANLPVSNPPKQSS